MQKALIIFGISCISLFVFSEVNATSDLDSISFATYYPAPYGVYNEMRLHPHTTTTVCTAPEEGTMYYDNVTHLLKVCSDKGAAVYDWVNVGSPAGAVMFFNLPTCPSGWSALTVAQGRYLVGAPSGGAIGPTSAVGTALTTMENRAAGGHTHSYSETQYAYGYGGGWAYTGRMTFTGGGVTGLGGSLSGTNAPYIQLLACQKD